VSVVFLDGKFVTPDEARVSVFDAGLQHGVGLFETMLGGVPSGNGGVWVFRVDEHLQRLAGSAKALGLSGSLDPGGLREAVLETLRRAALPRARVRLTITGGDLGRAGPPSGRHDPTVIIAAQAATEYPAQMFESGIAAVIADARANPLNPAEGHKCLNYWWRLRELQAAGAKGAGEALVFQVSNHLAGGCVSNAFLVHRGELITPIARGEEGRADPGAGVGSAARAEMGTGGGVGGEPKKAALPSPVLPGITRGFVLDWAAGAGVAVHRRMVSIDDVLGADELFLTNSSWGILPVVRVEREQIGPGTVGQMTTRIRDAWLASLVGTD
jgi:branched-chain amino acid aminotransferase